MRLADKVAVVTGSGSGIGRATARLFAREGARVVVAERRAETGEETVGMIRDAGGEAIFVETDVTRTPDVQRMVRAAVDTYGKLNVLVNNAAMARSTAILNQTEDDWDLTLDACLKSVYRGAKAAIPEMLKAGGGSIVNISSVNGLITNPAFTSYSAAKAGVLGLTRSLALDYGHAGI